MTEATTSRVEAAKAFEDPATGAQALVRNSTREGAVLQAAVSGWTIRPNTIKKFVYRQIRWRSALFILFVVLPVLASSAYYLFVASDQYVSEFRFSLRSAQPVIATGAGRAISVSAGTTNPSVIWDSQAVVQYLKSRDVVDDLSKRIDIQTLYSNDDVDFLARLRKQAPIERAVEYWRSMVNPVYDYMTGVVSVEVRAFQPADAQLIAANILKLAEQRVNSMSDRARADRVASSELEVKNAEEALLASAQELRKFRDKEGILNPDKQADITALAQGKLRNELALEKARYDSMRRFLSADAPSMTMLQSEIASKQAAIDAEQSQLTRLPGSPATTHEGLKAASTNSQMSAIMGEYEKLATEQLFRGKAYEAAKEELTRARADAAQQELYLNAIVLPKTPELALYPQRLRNILLVMLGGLLAWALTCLAVYSVRDHV